MMRVVHRSLLSVVAILSISASVWAQPGTAVRIEVDAGRARQMPQLMRTGVFTFKADPAEYALGQRLADLRPGVVEIDIGGTVFQQADDADDAVQRIRKLIPLLARVRAAGGEPVLAITRIPVWLSSRPTALETVGGDVVPKASIVAPRDGREWAALVGRVIGELKSGLGRTPDIKIGWEPDQSAWQGSEAEYFAFYRDTVRGVRQADPRARVGGPSVSALYNGKGGDSAPPMLPRFLAYCAGTALPELGLQRLPVDFVVWHQFGTEAVLAWDIAARQVRAWLREAGYSESTSLLVGEWSSWAEWPNPSSPEHDLPTLAAYIVASLAAMERAGIQRAAFTSLLEQREVEAEPFIGSFGLFSNQFIKKPAYWAFHAISRLGDTRIHATSSDPLVSVIAGRTSARELAFVVAASTPSDRALQRTLIARTLAGGARLDQLRRELDGREVGRLVSGELSPDLLRASPAIKDSLREAVGAVVPLARRSADMRGRSRPISVRLAGFELSDSTVEVWRIDSRNANAHALRERIREYLQRRLSQEKQALGQGLTRRFEERGRRPEQVRQFTQVMNAGNREAALAARPAPERKLIRAMADEAQAFIEERLALVGQEINAWPELAFRADSHAPARAGDVFEFEIEDDSVALVRVMRR
jgi:hypothetical protein